MKQLGFIFWLLVLVPVWGEILPDFEPADLAKAETILFAPRSMARISAKMDPPGVSTSGVETLDIQDPVVLKGAADHTVPITLKYAETFVPPLATNYLIFLKGTGDHLEAVTPIGTIVGLTSYSEENPEELIMTGPDAWALLARCLIDEKDPACAVRLSTILSYAPPEIWVSIWSQVKGRKDECPVLWLAYQNIGMRVDGVSALKGFVEPGFPEEESFDQSGVRGAMIQLIPTMAGWFYRSGDHEDYRNILNFAKGQRGRIGVEALNGIEHSTQKSDLPELLDIFEHSPSIEIRYACMEHFYNILGKPQPSGIPVYDAFKTNPAKYTTLWKTRIAEAQSTIR